MVLSVEGFCRMKSSVVWIRRVGFGVLAGLFVLTTLSSVRAADDEGEKKEKSKSSSLGDLLSNLKDMKVPDSVSKFPEQLKELRDAYLKTTKTVEELQKEVVALRQEVKELREGQELLKKGEVGKISGAGSGTAMTAQEMTAEQLVSAYAEGGGLAKQKLDGRYLKVSGAIQEFQPGSKEIVIFLRAESSTSRVKCFFNRDNNFHVDVIASQGRLVSRNDRTTLLTIGQPVTVVGTCRGSVIDVQLENCHLEGIDSKRKEESK